MKLSFVRILLGLCVLVGAQSVVAKTQTVNGALSESEISAGMITTLTVKYSAADGDTENMLTTGLQLRLHFNSKMVSIGEVSDLLREGKQGSQEQMDSADYDNDPTTDKYLLTAWGDTSGDGWPYDTEQPTTLYTLPIEAISGFNGTTLNFSGSGAAGYTVDSPSVSIGKIPGTVSSLSSLSPSSSLTSVALEPSFSAETTSYTMSVAYPVSEITLVPTQTDGFASVDEFQVDSQTVTDNSISLNVGENTATVKVLAEDGEGTTTYTVVITRAEALALTIDAVPILSGANSSGFTVSGTCNLDGVSVEAKISSGEASVTGDSVDCADGVWSVTGIDASALAEGSIVVTATGTTALEENVATLNTTRDITGPVLTLATDLTVAAVDADGAPASDSAISAFLNEVSGQDATDSEVTIANNAPGQFPLGTTTVTFSATDSLGNASSASATVTVTDQAAPVIDVVSSIAFIGTEEGLPKTDPAIVDFLSGVTASDNVDGTIASVANDAPDLFIFGETTVNFTATDNAGNEANASSVVLIALDIVKPELTIAESISLTVDMPGDVKTSEDADIAAFIGAATATDNKDGDVTTLITNDGLTEYPIGVTTVTFKVSDSAGNETVKSATITISVLDTDDDGLPDFFETQSGLDPNDASDATADLDGDGISNLDEYTGGTDPAKDELPPTLTIPDDISIPATGRMTDVSLGVATAVDNKDGELEPSASNFGPYKPGKYEIVWTVQDAAGNASSATQNLKVLPLVSLTPSSVTTEGASVIVAVMLNGAVGYDITVPLTLTGTAAADSDYSADASSVTIASGQTSGSMTLNITADDIAESEESIVVTVGDLSDADAAAGASSERTVKVLEENLAPVLALVVSQNGSTGRLVTADGGSITISANYSDLNATDTHTFEWGASVNDLAGAAIDGATVTFDPSGMADSVVTISSSVSDDGNPVETATTSVSLKVMASAPALDSETDSDGDGVNDAEEGFGDSDGDGIPDYKDNIAESYLAPVSADSSLVMQGAVGTSISLGDSAFASGTDSVGLTEDQVVAITDDADEDYEYLGGLFDFVISGGIAGDSYSLVLPLSTPISDGAVYRKFVDASIGWQDFVVDADNAISSAARGTGSCPQPGNDLYSDGLVAGNDCIQLLIEDGGPNDADGAINGEVADPSGLATLYFGPPSADSTVTLSVTTIDAGGSATADVVVTAVDADGRSLTGMTVTAETSLSDSTVGSFTEGSAGEYSAILTPGDTGGSLTVTVAISNGTDSVSITSSSIEVNAKSGGGGCSVASNPSKDAGLPLLMALLVLMLLRRRFLQGGYFMRGRF